MIKTPGGCCSQTLTSSPMAPKPLSAYGCHRHLCPFTMWPPLASGRATTKLKTPYTIYTMLQLFKTYLTFTVPFLLSPMGAATAFGQAPGQADTLCVSHSANSYIVFDGQIKLADIGGVPDSTSSAIHPGYLAQLEGNVFMLRAAKRGAPPTSLFIKASDRVLATVVSYCPAPKQFLYDLRRSATDGGTLLRQAHRQNGQVLVTERLQSMKAGGGTVKNVRAKKDRVTLAVANIKVDHIAIYLHLKATNHSSIVYNTAHIGFENLTYYRRRLLGRKKTTSRAVLPIGPPTLRPVRPHGEAAFYVALPLYAVGRRGALSVTLRESGGIRSVPLLIPGKKLATAELF